MLRLCKIIKPGLFGGEIQKHPIALVMSEKALQGWNKKGIKALDSLIDDPLATAATSRRG